MSSILNIAGTSSNSFMLNGKTTLMQGDDTPEDYMGENGDVYFQSNGLIWAKASDVWHNMMTYGGFPDPSAYDGNFIYSDGTSWVTSDFNIEDILLIDDAESRYVHLTGDETIAGNKSFTGNTSISGNTTISGNTSLGGALTVSGVASFSQTIQGTALNALWGDIAEYNAGDALYEYGTLVQFGGDYEFTIATNEVNAVVANLDTAAVVMNNKNDFEYPLPIVLQGRVKVKVEGDVKKFDKLYLSTVTPGVASSIENGEHFGRALTDNTDGYVLANVCAKF